MQLGDIKLILVPTDYSTASAHALRTAIALARASGAEIQLFHVDVDPSTESVSPENIFPSQMLFDSVRAETATRLERVADEVREMGVRCTTVSHCGRSHAAIVEQARQARADLVVVGRHPRHGFGRSLLGTVAARVAEKAPCAVLVVPPADEPGVQASR